MAIVSFSKAFARLAAEDPKRIAVVCDGIEATRILQDNWPGARVIILSMHGSTEHIFRSIRAGAHGFLLKGSAGNEVVTAVRAVNDGHNYLSQKITDRVVGEFRGRDEISEEVTPLARLSPREREVLQLVVEGKASAEIAGILAISPNTVDTYRSRLMQKLGIRDLPGLVKFAIQHRLTPLE